MIQLRPHQQTIIDTLHENSKGQIIVPTGGGKTFCMIKDTQREFNSCNWDVVLSDPDRKTIVIVAPRILLAQQLCEDFDDTFVPLTSVTTCLVTVLFRGVVDTLRVRLLRGVVTFFAVDAVGLV